MGWTCQGADGSALHLGAGDAPSAQAMALETSDAKEASVGHPFLVPLFCMQASLAAWAVAWTLVYSAQAQLAVVPLVAFGHPVQPWATAVCASASA